MTLRAAARNAPVPKLEWFKGTFLGYITRNGSCKIHDFSGLLSQKRRCFMSSNKVTLPNICTALAGNQPYITEQTSEQGCLYDQQAPACCWQSVSLHHLFKLEQLFRYNTICEFMPKFE